MTRIRMALRKVTVLGGGGGVLFDQTAFTQTIGAERLTNPGNPFAFTADNPTSWTVTGESGTDPEVSEVGTSEGHGGAGTGYCNLFASAGSILIRQNNVMTVDTVYEVGVVIDTVVSGALLVRDPSDGLSAKVYTTAGEKTTLGKANSTDFQIIRNSNPVDITLKSATVKPITQNAAQTAAANVDHRFQFVLPVSPIVGQKIELWYRLPAGAAYNNGWVFYLERNADNTLWQVLLARYSAGSRTGVLAAITVPDETNCLRVVTSGDDHTCYTASDGIDGTFTQRGATQTSTVHNTAVQAKAMYSSTVIPDASWRFRATA